MTNKKLLEEILKRLCKTYFKKIKPRHIHIYITAPEKRFMSSRKLMGTGIEWKRKGKIILQIDREYVENADPISLTEKLIHELVHIDRKHTARQDFRKMEREAHAETKKILAYLKKRDAKLLKPFAHKA